MQALNTPDIQDPVPYVPGTVRGKKWIPPPRPEPASSSKDDEKVELDLDLGDGDDVEVALNAASTDEIVDLAGILGLHSMMNQVYLIVVYLGKKILERPTLGYQNSGIFM